MSNPEPELPNDAMSPEAFDAILQGIKSFGITDTEEIITMTVKGQKVQLRFSNVSDYDDIESQMRAEGLKGFAWVQSMRAEILARATTWINGVDVRNIDYATDPYTGDQRPLRLILADMYRRWGQQASLVLWKCYMVHCQRVEDDLIEQLPDSAIATEVEARFLQRVAEDLHTISALAVAETIAAGEADAPAAEA